MQWKNYTSITVLLDLSQSCAQTKASTVSSLSQAWWSSITPPPVEKADSKATDVIGIINQARASSESPGKQLALDFHHKRISKLSSSGIITFRSSRNQAVSSSTFLAGSVWEDGSEAVSLGLYGGNRTQGYGGQLNEFQGKERQEDEGRKDAQSKKGEGVAEYALRLLC
ncbi:hypothetical protein PCANC_16767 [Puccinia coronata f. sp. avenae]|uniref:Uncharacterized protein n=1 Tax=Puccinia coronata f. sp. avenae TaxID=200324 RepID=A0A2N5USB1_9BASI|nr:hypothetical protein PCANC_16767 [Puccinia coronata f. sp. avenae]